MQPLEPLWVLDQVLVQRCVDVVSDRFDLNLLEAADRKRGMIDWPRIGVFDRNREPSCGQSPGNPLLQTRSEGTDDRHRDDIGSHQPSTGTQYAPGLTEEPLSGVEVERAFKRNHTVDRVRFDGHFSGRAVAQIDAVVETGHRNPLASYSHLGFGDVETDNLFWFQRMRPQDVLVAEPETTVEHLIFAGYMGGICY